MNKYMPQKTYEVLSGLSNIDNFYYLFNIPYISEDADRDVKIRLRRNLNKSKIDKHIIDNIKTRRELLVNDLKKSNFNVCLLDAECKWRLIVGLGATHPQEVSMTLHHIYGIPYIPGSAIKGVTRQWAIFRFADRCIMSKSKQNGDDKDDGDISAYVKYIEKKLLKSSQDSSEDSGDTCNIESIEVDGATVEFPDIVKIFGNQKKAGEVYFMDAFPVGSINFQLDIMNPHYPKYYTGNQPPADWQNPNIIEFLTVEKTKFRFILYSHDENLLEIAKKLLKEALTMHGVGAKTSLGYGIFDIFNDEGG